jgi:hypothetical protein
MRFKALCVFIVCFTALLARAEESLVLGAVKTIPGVVIAIPLILVLGLREEIAHLPPATLDTINIGVGTSSFTVEVFAHVSHPLDRCYWVYEGGDINLPRFKQH